MLKAVRVLLLVSYGCMAVARTDPSQIHTIDSLKFGTYLIGDAAIFESVDADIHLTVQRPAKYPTPIIVAEYPWVSVIYIPLSLPFGCLDEWMQEN